MIEAIAYNFRNLANFEGRDNRPTFWWYVLFLVVIQFLLGMVMVIPMMIDMFGSAFDAAQSGVDPDQMQSQMMGGMVDSMRDQMWFGMITGVLTAALLLASFTRRLHDSGKPGWIALLVLALYLGSTVLNIVNMESIMAAMEESMLTTDPNVAIASQQQAMGYGLLAWVAYLVIIVFGVFDSENGPNQYGEEPHHN